MVRERPIRIEALIAAVRAAARVRRQHVPRDLLAAHALLEEAECKPCFRAEEAAHGRDAFLAAGADDLKSPMAAAKAQAQLLRRRLQRGMAPDQIERAPPIAEAGSQSLAIIEELWMPTNFRRAGY